MPIKRMWGGRFEEAGDDFINNFGASIGFDQEMAEEDIHGSHGSCKDAKSN